MPFRLQDQVLLFMPDVDERDNACHIKTLSGQRLHLDAETTQVTNKLEAGVVSLFKINDRSDNELVSIPTGTTNRFEFNAGATVDFNACTVEGLTGTSVGQLEANQINSSNTGYTTVDNELDDLQVRCTANTNRTTGLTANRMLESSGAGIIRASGILSNNVANKGSGSAQTFAGIVASNLSLFAGTSDPVGDGDHKNVAISGTTSSIILKNYTTSSGVDTPSSCVISLNDDIHGLRIQDNSSGDLEIVASNTKGSLNLAAGGAKYKIGGVQISTADLSDGADIVKSNTTTAQTLACSVLQLNGANGLQFGPSSPYHIKSDYSNNRLLYSSNFDHVFQAGTNGATTACQIANDGVNIIDLSDANIGYTASSGLTRVATRAYVGALLQSSTTQTSIINTIEYSNIVFREFDATPTALTLTINRPTTISKDLSLTGKISGDLEFNSASTIDFTDNTNLTASQFCALDANKHMITRAISDSDNVVLKSGVQLITGAKSFNAGCNALSGWNIFGGNLNLDNTDQITTHTTFGNSYVANTDQEYCASRGCVFLSGAQTITGDKTHEGTNTHDDLQIAADGTFKILDSVNIADGSILGVNAGRFVVSRSLGDSDGVVLKTQTQTIAGDKTFSNSITVGDINNNFSFLTNTGILALKSTAPAVQFNYTSGNTQLILNSASKLTCENADFEAGSGTHRAELFSSAYTGWVGVRNASQTPTNNNYMILQSNTGATQTSCAAGSSNTMTVGGVAYFQAYNSQNASYYNLHMASTNATAGDITSAAYSGISVFADLQELLSPTFTNLTLNSGFSNGLSYEHILQYSKLGDRVILRGAVTKSNAGAFASGDIICQLPTTIRSSKVEHFVEGNQQGFLTIAYPGANVIFTTSSQNVYTVYIDHIYYIV